MNSIGLGILTSVVCCATIFFIIFYYIAKSCYMSGEIEGVLSLIAWIISVGLLTWAGFYCNAPYEVEREYIVQVQSVKDHENNLYPVIIVEGDLINCLKLECLKGLAQDGSRLKVTIYKKGPYYGVYKDCSDRRSLEQIRKYERVK